MVIELGSVVRDFATGVNGTVVSMTVHLGGSPTAVLASRSAANGLMETSFEVGRLELVSDSAPGAYT